MSKRGRNKELIRKRDEQLCRRYYYWTEVRRLRFDGTIKKLSEEEFFISESRVMQIVRKMIGLYCRHRLHQDTLPEEYQHLADFACRRLDHCRYGEKKTACKDCPTHCYAPKERAQIREVMRWVGPRMTFYSPKDAVVHIFQKIMTKF